MATTNQQRDIELQRALMLVQLASILKNIGKNGDSMWCIDRAMSLVNSATAS